MVSKKKSWFFVFFVFPNAFNDINFNPNRTLSHPIVAKQQWVSTIWGGGKK